MGKKRTTILGSEDETVLKAKKAVKLEQKKLREGLVVEKHTVIEKTPEISPETSSVSIVEAVETPKTPKKVHIRSRAYKAAKSQVDVEKIYPLSDGLHLLHTVSLAKFDSTVELHITLKAKTPVMEIALPHSTGKTRRFAVANDVTVANIEKGIIDFDVLYASPAQMGKLVKFARVLGPKGLMPNPKTGTVTADPDKAAADAAKKVSITLKAEKDAPIIHTIAGKLSFPDTDLTDNITAIVTALPQNQIKKVVLKSTMSPAIKISL